MEHVLVATCCGGFVCSDEFGPNGYSPCEICGHVVTDDLVEEHIIHDDGSVEVVK